MKSIFIPMLEVVRKFPEQVEEALAIELNFDIDFSKVKRVVVAGMGGSAISADILSHFSTIPFHVVRDYTPPSFMDENTLFIAVSYSGNTEETLSCFSLARDKCQHVAITTGGKLGEEAENVIKIPSGMQPRAAIAYLLFPMAKMLSNAGFMNIDFEEMIYNLKSNREEMEEMAKKVSNAIHGIPIIYGYGVMGSIARRWRQQFNENAKMHAFDFSLPECNHNEMEAWEENAENITCIFLREKNEMERIKARFDFMKEEYGKKANIIELYAPGKNTFSRAMYHMHVGDLASIYMAEKRGVDTEPVNLIMKLKNVLSQHSRSSS